MQQIFNEIQKKKHFLALCNDTSFETTDLYLKRHEIDCGTHLFFFLFENTEWNSI
jgi:hypothetical protein